MADDHAGESRVLLFGSDNGLLTTRQLLLERNGCEVSVVRTFQDFCMHVRDRAFDLILLCQSLSADECELASRFAQERAPSARLLLMFTRVGSSIPGHADVLLDSLAGPKVFIETARRMLAGNAGQLA